MASDPRRRVPSVDALLRLAAAREASRNFGREVVRLAVRETLADARAEARRGRELPPPGALMAIAARRAATAFNGVAPVINATGVLLHTGLGRAPLSDDAVRAVTRVARTYADLEVDRDTGRRGRRSERAEFLLRALTGAEAAFVVNNNAAALLLGLAALASRREVLVSRGELIEIGGEFRLPDIMAASGARLVEVGTTNRTRLRDYERGFGDRTALVLKVHPSNYRVSGFAEAAPLARLAELTRARGVPLLHDLGSGLLGRSAPMPPDEPSARESLRSGADLVCFSGDKLLGGPQAGIVLGRRELVERLRRHPVARALRVDVLTLAALEATLRAHATAATEQLPLWRSVRSTRRDLRARARIIADRLAGAEVVDTRAVAGGGAAPGHELPSVGVRIPTRQPEELSRALRVGRPAVFCRIDEGAVVLDLRAVAPSQDEELRRAVTYALGS